MNKIEAFLLSPTFLSFLGFALLLLLTLWLLNTFKMPPKRGPHLRNWLRGNYWLAMVVAGLTLGGAAAFFYLIEIGISVRAIVDRLVTAAADPSTPAEDLRNLGTATGILLAALAAAATLVFQLVRVWITERQTVVAEQNRALEEMKVVNQRLEAAVYRLGSRIESQKVGRLKHTRTGDLESSEIEWLDDKIETDNSVDGVARDGWREYSHQRPDIDARELALWELDSLRVEHPSSAQRIEQIFASYVRRRSSL